MAIAINLVQVEPTDDSQDSAKILNFETVASYNWLDEPRPTILVPGIPPIWDPPQTNPTLKPDTGGRYIDQNADRTPGSPLQALIHAVQACQPGFEFTNVSIVTDRKPMRYLLNFVRAEPSAFNFGIAIVGNTALFTCMEGETRDRNPKRIAKGYRDALEEQYTKIPASAARTTSHHRVVKYDFADQTILLRYAVDAYLGDLDDLRMQSNSNEDIDLGPLTKQHRTIDMRGVPPSKILPSDTPVRVVSGGRHIPHAATVELTTRSNYGQAPDNIQQKLPNFWISQTLRYLLCFHRESKSGSNRRSTNFDRIRLISMGNLLVDWEQSNAERLRALANVLGQVIKAAQELGGSCIISSDGSQRSSLKVSRDEAKEVPALPKDMQSLFLPIKDEITDVTIKQDEVAMTATPASPDGTRKRKYGTDDAPEVTGLPPAKRTALDSSYRAFGKVSIATPTITTAYGGTRKRKLDAEDASELTDVRVSRSREFSSSFCTPGLQGVTTIKEEESSVKVKDEVVDSEMEM